MTSIRPSTVVRRTEAGRAELATPAHGLSLAQRRFLTLLDTAASVDALAQRQRTEAAKLERDVARLATLGLVVCEEPVPANEATAENAANEPMPQATAVRLGAPRAVRRVAAIGAALLVAVLAWTAWQYGSTRAPEDRTRAIESKTAVVPQAPQAAASDPQPIATRVLRGEPTERARDIGKDARVPAKRAAAEPLPNGEVRPPALPVERRGPAPAAAIDPSLTRAPMPSPADDPAPMLLPMPAPFSTPAPALLPMPVAPIPATDAAQAPVRVATAAPSSTAPRQALAPLVPIARETPAFPREAMAAGLDAGNVKARLTIGADGNVESVDIVNASHRSFHRAVRDALAHWRFAPGAPGRTTDVDVAFKRD